MGSGSTLLMCCCGVDSFFHSFIRSFVRSILFRLWVRIGRSHWFVLVLKNCCSTKIIKDWFAQLMLSNSLLCFAVLQE